VERPHPPGPDQGHPDRLAVVVVHDSPQLP
jgi:hypothetical protein